MALRVVAGAECGIPPGTGPAGQAEAEDPGGGMGLYCGPASQGAELEELVAGKRRVRNNPVLYVAQIGRVAGFATHRGSASNGVDGT